MHHHKDPDHFTGLHERYDMSHFVNSLYFVQDLKKPRKYITCNNKTTEVKKDHVQDRSYSRRWHR